MLANKDTVMTKSNEEGIDRVYKGDEEYAFLMESKSIEYTTERKCNLTMVGKPLDDKNYGIGMRKGILLLNARDNHLIDKMYHLPQL